MSGNVRNSRTTHPRKQERRQRAADRFDINPSRRRDKDYMARKEDEALSLGLHVSVVNGL